MGIFKKSEKDKEEIRQSKKILGGFLVFLAVGMLILGGNLMMQTSWPKAEGTVTGAEIKERHHKSSKASRVHSDGNPTRKYSRYREKVDYLLKVDYQYSVDGENYTGRDSAGSSRDRDEIKAKIEDNYPVGKKIQIAYNPGNKTESTLHPGWGGNFILVFLLSGVLGFFGFKLITAKKPETIAPEDF